MRGRGPVILGWRPQEITRMNSIHGLLVRGQLVLRPRRGRGKGEDGVVHVMPVGRLVPLVPFYQCSLSSWSRSFPGDPLLRCL